MNNQPEEHSQLEQWIVDSRNGDEGALNQLAEYLLPKAFEFASWKMLELSPVDDHEDIAVSAVKSVCIRFREGHKEFLGEKELTSLLRQFVIGKIRDRRKYHLAEKRNVNLNVSEYLANPHSDESVSRSPIHENATDDPKSIWLDDASSSLPADEQAYLQTMLSGLGSDVQGLFSELVKRLDDNPRRVLMLITTRAMTNLELAAELDCAPASIERYRKAIRRKIEEIVRE